MCSRAQLWLRMVKQHRVSRERLVAAGQAAAKKACDGMAKHLGVAVDSSALSCDYKGAVDDGASLRATTRVRFLWTCKHGSSATEVEARAVFYDDHLVGPTMLKRSFLASCAPAALEQRRSIPVLARESARIRCRCLAVPKIVKFYETVLLGPKKTEHVLCHHLRDNEYVVCPLGRKVLSTAVVDEKIPRSGPSEQVCGFIAAGVFHAEVLKSSEEKRAFDFEAADAFFEKDATAWPPKVKNAFVLWAVETSEGWEQRASEVSFSSIAKKR